jgi:hypothetical protein
VLAVAVVVVAVLAVGGSLELLYHPWGGGQTSATACPGCFSEPVVDIIMPALGSSGNFTNPNRVVNMTVGETKTFEVDIYPTVPVSFTMGFSIISVSGGTSAITATFQPSSLQLAANAKGTTYMTVRVPGTAAKGVYDAVVSASSVSNSSEVWGLYFEIEVG